MITKDTRTTTNAQRLAAWRERMRPEPSRPCAWVESGWFVFFVAAALFAHAALGGGW